MFGMSAERNGVERPFAFLKNTSYYLHSNCCCVDMKYLTAQLRKSSTVISSSLIVIYAKHRVIAAGRSASAVGSRFSSVVIMLLLREDAFSIFEFSSGLSSFFNSFAVA